MKKYIKIFFYIVSIAPLFQLFYFVLSGGEYLTADESKLLLGIFFFIGLFSVLVTTMNDESDKE